MTLSEIDRNLLERCLDGKPRAWEDFVDRFMGLVLHVVNHTAQSRSLRLTGDDREDFCADVFLNIVRDDFAVLRHFRGESSLATYLTVVARRVVVRAMLRRKATAPLTEGAAIDPRPSPELRLANQEEVERMLEGLGDREAQAVRMYHLESKSYQEIAKVLEIPENSVGPILSRARSRLRSAGVSPTPG